MDARDSIVSIEGFNEGYHSGYNSALAKAAQKFRQAAEFCKQRGMVSEASSYETCARELVGMMRCNPLGSES